MMNLDKAAKEVFQILKSYNYVAQFFDADGGSVENVEDARRMYVKSKNMLLTIIDDGENSSVNLSIGKSVDIKSIEGMIQTLRTASTKYMLNFHVKRYDSEINPKSDAIRETIKGNDMNILEGFYGNTKTSYMDYPQSRLILKHSGKVDESKHGARTRCIENIFIENALGERFLFKTNNILPARAMAQHISMGGGFTDTVGSQITEMAKDFKNLAICSNHVLNNSEALSESAGVVREACKKKMSSMKKTFERMSRPNGYTIEAAKILEDEKTLIENEDNSKMDADHMNNIRSMIALEGVSLSDELIESVCKAMEDENLTEDGTTRVFDKELNANNSVSILGKRVKTQAFSDLCAGKVELTHPVDLADVGSSLRSKDALITMDAIIPAIKDDSLMNLMTYIVSSLENPQTIRDQINAARQNFDRTDGTETVGKTKNSAPVSSVFAKANPEEVITKMKKLVTAVIAAVKREQGAVPNIPSKMPAVVEYFNWFNKLSAKSVLNERDTLTPRQFMGHNSYDDEEENEKKEADAIDAVMVDFDAEDFVKSFVDQNNMDDDSLEPEERIVDRASLLHDLESYLLNKVSQYDDELMLKSMKDDAETLLPKVMDNLEDMGFVINEEVDESEMSLDDSPDNFDLRQMISALDQEQGLDDHDMVAPSRELDERDFNPFSADDVIGDDTHRAFKGTLDDFESDRFSADELDWLGDGDDDELLEFSSDKEPDLNNLDLSDLEISDSALELPSENEGDSLRAEVTKRRVRSPVDGSERDPSEEYIAQLRALSGITNPNPQTY